MRAASRPGRRAADGGDVDARPGGSGGVIGRGAARGLFGGRGGERRGGSGQSGRALRFRRRLGERIEHGLLPLQRLHQSLDQGSQLRDLRRERVADHAGVIRSRLDFPFQGGNASSHLGDLARDVGASARQIGELAAHHRSKPDAGGNRVVERQRR
jgi:hypothetical protein